MPNNVVTYDPEVYITNVTLSPPSPAWTYAPSTIVWNESHTIGQITGTTGVTDLGGGISGGGSGGDTWSGASQVYGESPASTGTGSVQELEDLIHLYSDPVPHPSIVQPKSGKMVIKSDEQFYNKKLSTIINYKHGPQSGDVGLEIECEGTNLFRAPFSYWSCHEDGSLRTIKGHPACEYVLKAPLGIKELHDALSYLNVKLKESGSEVIQSQRTSVHVHVNCQKMLVRDLYNYLCLYLIFEEVLVEWSGPDRAGNLFCLRGKDSDFYVNMLESVLKNKSFKQWRDEYRYSACNVASIPKFGSLEFRSMKGTVDIDTIMTWVGILLHLKEMSRKYKSPVEIVEDFVAIGPLPFFKKIFKDDQRKVLEGIPGLSGKLWDGLRMMRDVAYSCEWKPPADKKKRQKRIKLLIEL